MFLQRHSGSGAARQSAAGAVDLAASRPVYYRWTQVAEFSPDIQGGVPSSLTGIPKAASCLSTASLLFRKGSTQLTEDCEKPPGQPAPDAPPVLFSKF